MSNFDSGWTNDYVGCQFKSKGRDRKGWDCWGLIRVVYEEQLGIKLPILLGEYRSAHEMDGIQELIGNEKVRWVGVSEKQEGDVITFRVMGRETHLGLVAPDGKMLHVMDGTDTCLQPLTSTNWSRRVTGFFRHSQAIS